MRRCDTSRIGACLRHNIRPASRRATLPVATEWAKPHRRHTGPLSKFSRERSGFASLQLTLHRPLFVCENGRIGWHGLALAGMALFFTPKSHATLLFACNTMIHNV